MGGSTAYTEAYKWLCDFQIQCERLPQVITTVRMEMLALQANMEKFEKTVAALPKMDTTEPAVEAPNG